MRRLDLDADVRRHLAQRILAALEDAVQGSDARLRGSLADGTADQYSDIDVFWEVPDEEFEPSVAQLSQILSQVREVESLRLAPDYQRSDRRRLAFVQFKDTPLFWRVDLDIFARSLEGDLAYDVGNQAARGDDWSLTHSALMNGVGAIKALQRGKREQARELLARGFQRVGLAVSEGDTWEMVVELAERVVAMGPGTAGLARRVVELKRWALERREDQPYRGG